MFLGRLRAKLKAAKRQWRRNEICLVSIRRQRREKLFSQIATRGKAVIFAENLILCVSQNKPAFLKIFSLEAHNFLSENKIKLFWMTREINYCIFFFSPLDSHLCFGFSGFSKTMNALNISTRAVLLDGILCANNEIHGLVRKKYLTYV